MTWTKWMVRTTHDGRQISYIYDTKREAMAHIEAYNTNDYEHILCKLRCEAVAENDVEPSKED